MYFEDEKENMTDAALDDLDLDMDGDDKTVTWDDLLDDDAGIDLDSAKKQGDFDDESLLDSSDDLSLEDEVVEDIRPQPVQRQRAPRKDAFDVFGGEPSSVPSTPGDAFTPDLTNRPSARRKAAIENGEDDDIYFEPKKAKKSSSNFIPTLVGVLVALLFIGGVGYLFMTYGKSVAGLDASSLLNNSQSQETAPMISDDMNKPAVDINAPADANAAGEENKENADEQKLVTFAIQNGGRINPFVPPSGFESSKYATSSGYEILSPPEEVPEPEVAEEAKKLMDITVSGILFDNVKPSAIVSVSGSDYYVQVGDKVDDFQVVAINRQYVAIKNGTNIYKAQVGENFGTKAPVDGMATRQTSGKFAGAKQYTSASEVEVSVK